MILGIICIRKKGKENWLRRRIELWGNCNSSLSFSYVNSSSNGSSELSWIEARVLSLCISHDPIMGSAMELRTGCKFGQSGFLCPRAIPMKEIHLWVPTINTSSSWDKECLGPDWRGERNLTGEEPGLQTMEILNERYGRY